MNLLTRRSALKMPARENMETAAETAIILTTSIPEQRRPFSSLQLAEALAEADIFISFGSSAYITPPT